jgi:hypothetical protein
MMMPKDNFLNVPGQQDLSCTTFLLWMNDVVDFCEPGMLDWCQDNNNMYHNLQIKILEQQTTLISEKLKNEIQ